MLLLRVSNGPTTWSFIRINPLGLNTCSLCLACVCQIRQAFSILFYFMSHPSRRCCDTEEWKTALFRLESKAWTAKSSANSQAVPCMRNWAWALLLHLLGGLLESWQHCLCCWPTRSEERVPPHLTLQVQNKQKGGGIDTNHWEGKKRAFLYNGSPVPPGMATEWERGHSLQRKSDGIK